MKLKLAEKIALGIFGLMGICYAGMCVHIGRGYKKGIEERNRIYEENMKQMEARSAETDKMLHDMYEDLYKDLRKSAKPND